MTQKYNKILSFSFFAVITPQITITAPEVIIVNEFFEPLFDTFYEAASTIQLNCVVKYITMSYSVVHWTHNGRLLNDDIIRGGIRYLFLIKIILCIVGLLPHNFWVCVPLRSTNTGKTVTTTHTHHNFIHFLYMYAKY